MIEADSSHLPPQHAIFMKVGYHAQTLNDIITRKIKEEQECGLFYWGYGGTLCHPTSQVIPFVEQVLRAGPEPPILLMSITNSRYIGSSKCATEYSIDNKSWLPLPKDILVSSSKYALICKSLTPVKLDVDLGQYSVAVGPSANRAVVEYLRARVDKVCATRVTKTNNSHRNITVSYIAKLVSPYAVLVR